MSLQIILKLLSTYPCILCSLI